MFKELSTLLQLLPFEAPRPAFEAAVLQENVLGKRTISSRKRTLEHLLSLYGLDPSIPVFRFLRHFWRLDPTGRAQIVLVAAGARDPLLQLGTDFILPLRWANGIAEPHSRNLSPTVSAAGLAIKCGEVWHRTSHRRLLKRGFLLAGR